MAVSKKKAKEQKLGPLQEGLCKLFEESKKPQGRHALSYKKDGKWHYCCLGLICERDKLPVEVYENGEVMHLDEKVSVRHYGEIIDRSASTIPLGFAEKYKFRDQGILAQLNDKDKKTFAEIAALIRAKPSRFFTEEA